MKDDPLHYDEMPRYYKILFNAVTTALIAMNRMDFGTAKRCLIEGQTEAEEAFISDLKEKGDDEGKETEGHVLSEPEADVF